MTKNHITQQEVERIRQIYCNDVLRHRSRPVQLPGRKCEPEIQYTFLGIELKAGKMRITCPDPTTARYLKVFAEIGLPAVRIPYDPTRTAVLVVGLEHALRQIKEQCRKERFHQRKLRRVYRQIREACVCKGVPVATGDL